MRDPERPYAQLLTPVAKSQKLLLRLRHDKLLPSVTIIHSQAVFALWQKLLAKNIPSVPWPDFADLLLYPEDQYLAVKLRPFGELSSLQQAWQARHLSGYVLVDAATDAPYLALEGSKPVVAAHLADRIGSRWWQWLGGELSPWQSRLLASLTLPDGDTALDLLGLLRECVVAPWPLDGADAPPFVELAQAFFMIWRARGNAVAAPRLTAAGLDEAVDWLLRQSGAIRQTEKGYAIRKQDEEMVH